LIREKAVPIPSVIIKIIIPNTKMYMQDFEDDLLIPFMKNESSIVCFPV
jgi:hypothetical protein